MKTQFFLTVLFVIWLVACQNNEQSDTSGSPPPEDSLAWVEAQKINTVDAYNDFICKYPKSKYVELATLKINKLKEEELWQKTIDINTIEAYHNFCKMYPYSVHHGEAIENVDKILKEQLQTKYHRIIDFLRIMSKEPTYENFEKFRDKDFVFIKNIDVESTGEVADSIYINSEQDFNKYFSGSLFKVCYDIYLSDTTSENQTYQLLCCPEGIGILFHNGCDNILMKWKIYGNELRLYRIEYKHFIQCD